MQLTVTYSQWYKSVFIWSQHNEADEILKSKNQPVNHTAGGINQLVYCMLVLLLVTISRYIAQYTAGGITEYTAGGITGYNACDIPLYIADGSISILLVFIYCWWYNILLAVLLLVYCSSYYYQYAVGGISILLVESVSRSAS